MNLEDRNPWAHKQYARCVDEARRAWGHGWGHLSDQQRLGAVAIRALAAIGSNDDTTTDSAERAARFRDLATLVLTEGL